MRSLARSVRGRALRGLPQAGRAALRISRFVLSIEMRAGAASL